jgi:hypothetical protein
MIFALDGIDDTIEGSLAIRSENDSGGNDDDHAKQGDEPKALH